MRAPVTASPEEAPLPDDAILLGRLRSLVRGELELVGILERTMKRAGTFPKEIVAVAARDGRTLEFFCKYSADRFDAYGHRAGVAYEANVYRHVLVPIGATAPMFLGAGDDDALGHAWLVLEFLPGENRLSENPAEMEDAASWIGDFHRVNEARVREGSLPDLIVYDEDYYVGWARRTSQFAGHRHERFPWLAEFCRRSEEILPILVEGPPTVIHGEYTVHNIMTSGRRILPSDWESAAIACGEIDLASLTDRWPPETVAACRRAYVDARWPEGAPAGFYERVDVSELYLHLRWLGEHPELMSGKKRVWRFERLEALARRLQLLDGVR